MKIALCQTDILWEDKKENLKKAEKFLKRAKEGGSEIAFFPEMSFTGFSMHTEKTGEWEKDTVGAVQKMAEEQGIAVGFGWTEKTKDKAKNHYTVVDRRGRILGDYVKIHPFSYADEQRYFEAGQELCCFSAGTLRIGILICYDLRFPEPFQVLAESCDFIVVPANWPERRREHWKCMLQARAIECQVYLAGINCCGDQEGLSYSGDSCAFAPDGSRLAGFLEEEGILFFEIPENVQEFRESFPTRRDRRWNLYRKWYDIS